MSGKGSRQRPGKGYSAGYDAIFTKPPPMCGLCHKPVACCGCVPTDDGPGQSGAEKETVYECVYAVDRLGNQRLISKRPADGGEVKTHYERRRFDREGV